VKKVDQLAICGNKGIATVTNAGELDKFAAHERTGEQPPHPQADWFNQISDPTMPAPVNENANIDPQLIVSGQRVSRDLNVAVNGAK
jgi:hypothetical protein